MNNKKLYIINQHYYPELASTAQVFQEIAEYFVTVGYDVTVIAGIPFYHDNISAEHYKLNGLNGVKIKRLWNTVFNKSSFMGKGLNLLTFQVSLLFYTLFRIKKYSIVMAGTNPPLAVVSAALAKIFKRFKLVSVVQDLYPDILISSGYANEDALPYKLLSKVMKRSFRRCDSVVTISHDMGMHISRTYEIDHVDIINNMVIGEIFPMRNNELKAREGLSDKLVVMYSGNFGVAHEYETLFNTVMLLKNNVDIVFRIVGGGINYNLFKEACASENFSNITFLPYVDKEELNENLNLADIHIIIFNDNFKNVLMPSKYYGILASGKPFIIIADGENDISRDIGSDHMGFVIRRGDSTGLLRILLDIAENKDKLLEMSEKAIRLYNEKYSRDLVFEKYRQLLKEL